MRVSVLFATVLMCSASAHAAQDVDIKVSPSEQIDERVQALLTKVKRSLRPLKAGTFEMGDWGGESGLPYDMDTHSRPLHKVTLDGFSMMAYKVTYEDFDVFTEATGDEQIDMDRISIKDRSPKRPAGVSWHGAKAYCSWLAKLSNLPFDLPTEAQWEYAARSGGKRVLFATDTGMLDRPRNFPREWEYGEPPTTIPDVGSYPPNPVGLYGMSENTHEWVQDWFDENYYKKSPVKNPSGPDTGTKKVKRGTVGGNAEMSAMVFMRTKSVPQSLRAAFPNGIQGGVSWIPFSGFSGYNIDNFRCVVNLKIEALN